MATVKELQTQLNAANARIAELEAIDKHDERKFELIKAQLQAKTLSGFDDMSTSQVRCVIRNADRILVEMGE